MHVKNILRVLCMQVLTEPCRGTKTFEEDGLAGDRVPDDERARGGDDLPKCALRPRGRSWCEDRGYSLSCPCSSWWSLAAEIIAHKATHD